MAKVRERLAAQFDYQLLCQEALGAEDLAAQRGATNLLSAAAG